MTKSVLPEKRKLRTTIYENLPGITLKANYKTIRRNAASISLPVGTEIEAWHDGKVIGAMIVKEGSLEIVIDEYTTADWILKKLHLQLNANKKMEFVSIIKGHMNEGLDIYTILSSDDIGGWLTGTINEGKIKNISMGIKRTIPIDEVLDIIRGSKNTRMKLRETTSKFEEFKR